MVKIYSCFDTSDKFLNSTDISLIMSNEDPLNNWMFLLGKWKGGSTDLSGSEGETVSTATFSKELGAFIMGKIDTFRKSKLESANMSMMFFDHREKRFKRKTFFSDGVVHDEVEVEISETEIVFEVSLESPPPAFDGMRWRSYVRKISDTEVCFGLLTAKNDADFEPYGESILVKSE